VIDIKLNSELNDLEIVNGDFVLVDGIESIVQGLRVRLATIYGEWYLNNKIGVIVFSDKPDPDDLDEAIKEEVVKEDGVETIINYNSDFDAKKRVLNVDFEVNTTYGVVTLKEGLRA